MMNTVKLAKKLISYDTSTKEGKEKCIRFLSDYLRSNKIKFKIHESNGIKNIVCKYGKGRPVLCFNGHYDVVSANEKEWKITKPYKPLVKSGKLYGRGASDMKTALASMINTFIKLTKTKINGTIILMIVGDEETGGFNGTGNLIKKFKNIDYAIIGESTDLNFKVARRGVTQSTIKFFGKPGHASKPEEAENVIPSMAEAILKISKIRMTYKKSKLLPKPSLAVTIVSAGEKQNVIPGYGEIKLDIRHVPSQNQKTIENDLKKALKNIKCKYELEVKELAKPFYTKKGKLIKISTKIMKNLGINPKFLSTGGSSDGRFFAEIGSEVLECGLDENQHKSDEFITLKKLEKLEKFYFEVAKTILNYRN